MKLETDARCAAPSPALAGEGRGGGSLGALSALGLAERAPTRLALLGTLPRKRRKREREGHTADVVTQIRDNHPLGAPTLENRLRMRIDRVSQTSR
jgi:hypothetical protein